MPEIVARGTDLRWPGMINLRGLLTSALPSWPLALPMHTLLSHNHSFPSLWSHRSKDNQSGQWSGEEMHNVQESVDADELMMPHVNSRSL